MDTAPSAALSASAALILAAACVDPGAGDDDATSPGSADDDDATTSPPTDDDSGGDDDGSDPTPPPYDVGFEEVASERGLWDEPVAGFGVAADDVDGDGWPDLVFSGRMAQNDWQPSRLYLNDGSGNFADATDTWGQVTEQMAVWGATLVDHDGDGDRDLWLATQFGPRALRNDGDGWTDVSFALTLPAADGLFSSGVSFGDYDGDGRLDAYVTNHFFLDAEKGVPTTDFPADLLLHQRANGTFEDVSELLPAERLVGAGFVSGWTDADEDGDLDLYVVNDIGQVVSNQLFENNGLGPSGDWSFTPAGGGCGCELEISGMGLALADADGDGHLDMYMTNVLEGGEVLLKGQGDGSFVDVSLTAGVVVTQSEDDGTSWGTEFMDFDNDGAPDLFVAFGSKFEPQPHVEKMLQNQGDGTFVEVTDLGLEDGLDDSHGATVLDIDLDGCLDIAVANRDWRQRLYRNVCASGNHFVGFRLVGDAPNTDAIGARVVIEAGGRTQVQEVYAGSTSVHSSRWKTLHFGLGAAESVDVLTVRWPDGSVDEWTEVAGDRYLELRPGEAP